MSKKIFAALLALVMCVGVLTSCSFLPFGKGDESENEGSKDVVESGNQDNSNSESESVEEGDGLGEYDFKGATFTILSRKSTDYEHNGSLSGDSVSQQVYLRNQEVSKRFNVNINIYTLAGDWDQRDDFVTAIRAENMAPTGSYDLVSTHSVYLGWLGMEGVAHDLSTLPEVDLTRDWWNQNSYKELNINGKCYMMLGDIGHTIYEYISVMFVNTKLIENENIIDGGMDTLYDMIEDGEWTWGELYEMSKDFGVGVETPTYGLLFNAHALRAALMSQDAYLYDRDENGKLYMELTADEHLVKSVENLSQFFARSNMLYAAGWGTAWNELNPIFTADQALFYAQTLGEAANFQSMGSNYSVLPLPKYDEFQTDYYTICRDTVTGVMVMNCAKDLTMSGVVTQALCYYGAELVTPEYYEKVLKYRYNSDPRSIEMIDKVRDSLTIQPHATYYDTGIDFDMFSDIVKNGQTEGIASKYAEFSQRGNSELQTFYDKIALLD